MTDVLPPADNASTVPPSHMWLSQTSLLFSTALALLTGVFAWHGSVIVTSYVDGDGLLAAVRRMRQCSRWWLRHNATLQKQGRAIIVKRKNMNAPASGGTATSSGTTESKAAKALSPSAQLWREFRSARMDLILPATLLSVTFVAAKVVVSPTLTGEMVDLASFAQRASLAGRGMNETGGVADREALEAEFWVSLWPTLHKWLMVFLVRWACLVVSVGLETVASQNLRKDLGVRMFQAIMEQDTAFFDRNKSGELASRLRTDTTAVSEALVHTVTRLLKSLLRVFVSGGAMVLYHPRMALIVALTAPAEVYLGKKMGEHAHRLAAVHAKKTAETSALATEVIANNRTVKSLAAEKYEIALYSKRLTEIVSILRLGLAVKLTFKFGHRLLQYLQAFSTHAFGLYFVFVGDITAGQFIGFKSFHGTLKEGVQDLLDWHHTWQQTLSHAGRYYELVERMPSIQMGRGVRPDSDHSSVTDSASDAGAAARVGSGVLEMRDVWYRYDAMARSERAAEARSMDCDIGETENESSGETLAVSAGAGFAGDDAADPDRWDVRGVSLTLRPGRLVAIVGPSGAGKSTISALLSRLYDPQRGTIEYEGRDIRQLDVEWFRSQVGVVEQMPSLFDRSVADNIAYALGATQLPAHDGDGKGPRDPVPRERIIRAAKQAHAHKFISQLPDGYDTLIGERGVTISGGERQRIAIARALVRDPPVLVLDEASSSLDTASEAAVQASLQESTATRATCVVAHRLSTVRDADEILVVDGGEVVQRGTHTGLLKDADGLYAKLCAHQLRGAEAEH